MKKSKYSRRSRLRGPTHPLRVEISGIQEVNTTPMRVGILDMQWKELEELLSMHIEEYVQTH